MVHLAQAGLHSLGDGAPERSWAQWLEIQASNSRLAVGRLLGPHSLPSLFLYFVYAFFFFLVSVA